MSRIVAAGAAERYPQSSAAYVAVTGCLLSIPAFLYSTRLHVPSRDGRAPAGLATLLHAFLAVALAPVALRHDSQLIGFLAAGALFGAVGFSVIPSGLCWHVRPPTLAPRHCILT